MQNSAISVYIKFARLSHVTLGRRVCLEEAGLPPILFVAISTCYLGVVYLYTNSHFLCNQVEIFSRMLLIKFYIAGAPYYLGLAFVYCLRAVNLARF